MLMEIHIFHIKIKRKGVGCLIIMKIMSKCKILMVLKIGDGKIPPLRRH